MDGSNFENIDQFLHYLKHPAEGKRNAYSLNEMKQVAVEYLDVFRRALHVVVGMQHLCNFSISRSLEIIKDFNQLPSTVQTEFPTLSVFFDSLLQFFEARPSDEAARALRSINTHKHETPSSPASLKQMHRFTIMSIFVDDMLFLTNGQLSIVFKAQIAVEPDFFVHTANDALEIVLTFLKTYDCRIEECEKYLEQLSHLSPKVLVRVCVSPEDCSRKADALCEDIFANIPNPCTYTLEVRPSSDNLHAWIELRSPHASILDRQSYWMMLPQMAPLDMPMLMQPNGHTTTIA